MSWYELETQRNGGVRIVIFWRFWLGLVSGSGSCEHMVYMKDPNPNGTEL